MDLGSTLHSQYFGSTFVLLFSVLETDESKRLVEPISALYPSSAGLFEGHLTYVCLAVSHCSVVGLF